jgi:hypothetical protein
MSSESSGFNRWFSKPIYEVENNKTYWNSWSKWSYLDDGMDDWGIVDKEGDKIKDKNSDKRLCEEALRAISRSANVILNSTESQEKRLTIKFSDGSDVNTPDSTNIYLSPDKLVSCSTREEKDEVIDSMSGQSMLTAQLKRQIPVDVYDLFSASEDREIRALWSAIETAIARGDIISDWSGFKPYFDIYAKFSSKVTSTVIKRQLSKHNGSSPEKPTSASALVMGLAWNLYHSHDPVKIPEVYKDGKMLIANALKDADTCEKRWNMCSEVVTALRSMYDAPTPPEASTPPPPGNPYGGDLEEIDTTELIAGLQDIEDQANPAAPKKVVRKKGFDKFTGVDEALFGVGAVDNKKCKAAADIEGISGDSTTELSDSVSAPMVPGGSARTTGRSVSRGVACWVDKDLPSKMTKAHYTKDKISELDKIAEAIKDSFGFTDKVAKRKLYGLKAGNLRIESLYKLEMGSDDVFFKKTEVDVDKVSVCLLIDQSGSMSCASESGVERVIEASEVAYVLAKLCRDIKHIDLSVIGFSAQESCKEAREKLKGEDINSEVNMRLIYDSMDGAHNKIEDICNIRSHANNLDGFSLWFAAKHMAETRAERKRKVLIVVSDGSPNGRGYGGEEATKHVATCRKDAKFRFGIDTFAIGISSAYSQREGDDMYGTGNNIVISDVKSSVGYLSRFLNQVSQIA